MLLLLKMASLWLLSQAAAAALLFTALVWPGCHYRIKQLCWLKQQKFIFLQFWRLQLQDSRCQQSWFLVRPLTLACNFTWQIGFWRGLLLWPAILHDSCKIPHTAFSQSVHTLISLPLLIKTPVLLDKVPILMTSVILNYLFKGPIFKYSLIKD